MTTSARRTFPPLTSNRRALDPERIAWLQPVPDAERHDRGALLARLRRDGYLYLRGLLDVERVLNFRRYYFTRLAACGLTRPGTPPELGLQGDHVDLARVRQVLFDEVVPGPEYEALCRAPELMALFELLLGGELHLHKRKIIRHQRTDDTYTTPAHYDLVYLRGGTEQLLSAWIPLGHVPLEQGGLVYLEGSHVWCEAFDRDATRKMVAQSITFDLAGLAREHDTRWLAADYAPGDVVIHSPFIVHASLDDTDPEGRMRLSTDIRYQRASDAIDTRWQNHWRDDDGL